jgi:hypothetical protein
MFFDRPVLRVLGEGAAIGLALAVVGTGVTWGMSKTNINSHLVSGSGIRAAQVGGAPLLPVMAGYFVSGVVLNAIYEASGHNAAVCLNR